MKGGSLGIQVRGQQAEARLRTLAKSDFMHDFGEGVAARDRFTSDDQVRFIELAQKYNIGVVRSATAVFESVVGSNPFRLLGNSINTIYPSQGGNDEFLNEDRALEAIGVRWQALKNQLKAQKNRVNRADEGSAVLRADPIRVNTPDGDRTYNVRAVMLKPGSGEDPYNIGSRFSLVTEGAKKFALVIDASGGLSLTSIRRSELEPSPRETCEFYILENIENQSDSATKLKNLDRDVGGARTKTNVFFLKDEQNAVLYPKFKIDAAQHHGEALFGNAELTLTRAGEDTEADFVFEDGQSYHIENVSQNANVKNASLNMLISAIKNNVPVIARTPLEIPPGIKEPYLFPYIKRVGDWCQALSLLDTTRKYTQFDENHAPTNTTTTLEDLKKQGAKIGLITLDRVLLAYALTLGINVFYTTATDLRMMIYFENAESGWTDADYNAQLAILRGNRYVTDTERSEDVVEVVDDNVPRILTQLVELVKAAYGTNDIEYIKTLRGAFHCASILRTTIPESNQKAAALYKAYKAAVTPKEMYTALSDFINLRQRLDADYAHNERQLQGGLAYPGSKEDEPTYRAAKAARPSRTAITRLKVIISKEMLNDVGQSKVVFQKYGQKVDTLLFGPKDAKYADIFQAFSPIQQIAYSGLSQKGGGFISSVADFADLYLFEVNAMDVRAYNALPDPPPDGALPVNTDIYYRDEKGFPYTVVNNYIVTKEDMPTFLGLYNRRKQLTPTQIKYMAYRFFLLQADMIQGAFEKLEGDEDYEDVYDNQAEPVRIGVRESTTRFIGHKRLRLQMSRLRATVNDTKNAVIDNMGSLITEMKAVESYSAEQIQEETGAGLRVAQYVNPGPVDPRTRQPLPSPYAVTRAGIRTLYERIETLLDEISTYPEWTNPPKRLNWLGKLGTYLQGIPCIGPACARKSKQEGGLRTRRPLYTNVQTASTSRSESVNHPRLRKRARTRRTPRVRQSARKSKTRR